MYGTFTDAVSVYLKSRLCACQRACQIEEISRAIVLGMTGMGHNGKKTTCEHRVRIEIEGSVQPTSSVFVTTGKQTENRRRGMGHRVALIGGDRLAGSFPKPRVRLGRTIAPTEHRLEVPGKRQIAECHGIR